MSNQVARRWISQIVHTFNRVYEDCRNGWAILAPTAHCPTQSTMSFSRMRIVMRPAVHFESSNCESRSWDQIGWSKSPCGISLSPPAVKIQAFGHNMINYNMCQIKYWHFTRNQFNGSFYRRSLRRDIDFQRISWTLSSDPWFAMTCSTKKQTWWSRRNSASYMARMFSVSVQ
jgi:hypothetical protein